MAVNAVTEASNQPVPKIQDWIETADTVCLAAASLIAVIILCGWLVPGVSSTLPDGWALMQSSTALAVLFLVAGLTLNRRQHNTRLLLASRVCASMAMLLALVALFEHWSGQTAVLARHLVTDSTLPLAHPMSIQSATSFVLLGLSLFIDHTRQDLLGHVSDALIMALVIGSLVFISGHIFSASHLIGSSSVILISPQTLICIVLLILVQTGRRAPYSFFSVLVSVGIGGQFARIVLPYSAVISYLIILGGERLLASGILTLPYAAAVTASSLAALLLVVVILLARKINALEKHLRDMSLTDELTGVLNRRGFYLLGEQLLSDARRSATATTLLFFDIDDLKKINDTQGHDTGSRLIQDIATLLRANFRGNDIVGRMGGDEFAVITHGIQNYMTSALQRLYDATDDANAPGNRPYKIGYSVGEVTIEPQNNESLDELLARADAAMYRSKREKRERRVIRNAARHVVAAGEVSHRG